MGMGKINIDKCLFEAEEKILEAAMADLADERFCNNALLSHYKILVHHYRKLLKLNKKIFHISDSQGQVLQRHQSEIQNLLDNANQGFLTFGRDFKVDRQYSAECTRIFGRKIGGKSIIELLGKGCPESKVNLYQIFEQVFESSSGTQGEFLQRMPTIFRIDDKDIRVECKLIEQSMEFIEGKLIMMILTDITDQLRAEEQIRFLSYHDKLTLLHNRAYVETLLCDLEGPQALPMSIIMLDMNGLKLVNDVFGHQQGDLLLISMADILKKSCRSSDIVARWGGDEFVILLPQTDQEECRKVCLRIQDFCKEVTDCTIPLSAAIGSATKDSGVARLTEMFNVAEYRMYNDKLLNGREVRKKIVSSLESILHNRCFENDGHSDRVKQLAFEFAEFIGLNLSDNDRKALIQLATMHDIGKVAISGEILGKAAPLTAGEWEIIKSHSDIGYRMAQSMGEPTVADMILALHEHWDGTGYPYGVKGDKIPLLARLFAIVDVYDVLTHHRPYKTAVDKAAALREIELGSGVQFDPELAERFINFMTFQTD